MGGLAGAGTMLLFAPQSGKNTRTQIQEKSFELREKTTQAIGNAVDLVKTKPNEIVDAVQQKAGEIQNRGQEMLDAQKSRWTPAEKAIKDAVQE